MDNNPSLRKSISKDQITQKQFNDFYKLHYPSRKSPSSTISKIPNKMRSKSVVSVFQTPQNQQPNQYYPKNSLQKIIANKQLKQLKSNIHIPKSPTKQSSNDIQRYTQNLSFKKLLSSQTAIRDLNTVIFPFNNMKQIEQFSKNNVNVRTAVQRAKDQKIKMNKIVMSHKQNQQVKLDYLKNKRQEVQDMINQEINHIYQEFFKKQYHAIYGSQEGQDKFQVKLAELVAVLSRRVFNN